MNEEGGLDVKAVILGATDVGKTSLTMRYCHGTFNHPTSATIGASFLQKRIVVDGVRMTLQIWDTAGQERFRSMAPMYYRNAKAAVLVFDLSQEDSFEKAKEWLEDLRKHVEPDIVLAIVGNKSDAPSAFDFKIAEDYAESVGAKAHKTSALQGTGVDDVFTDVARRLLAQHIEQRQQQQQGMSGVNNSRNAALDFNSLDEQPDQKKSGCC